jgi:hypothetical protein
VKSHLYVALDIGYLESGEFEQVNKLAEEVSRIIGGLKVAVGKKRNRK